MSTRSGTPEAAEAVRNIAIAGNPNCGKSTIFNALTGLRQRTGNYSGVTVERKIGRFHGAHGEPIDLLDLPGSYSLQVRSPDEAVARDVLLGRIKDTPRPEAIIAVVDASNLERNLYLVAQMLELGLPVVVALNMVDVAEKSGIRIDVAQLRENLGVPVVPMVATDGVGFVELKQALAQVQMASKPGAKLPELFHVEVLALASELRDLNIDPAVAEAEARLLLSAGDKLLLSEIATPKIVESTQAAQQRLRDAGIDPLSAPVEARYAWIHTICADAVTRTEDAHALSVSDRLDMWFTHHVWGWVAFIAVMALMFVCIFTVASYPMDWIDGAFGALGKGIEGLLPDGDFRSLVVDGAVAGVAGVVIFLPQILILFFFLGILEDSGYMARAAFIMDRLMSRVGLHGKSFIPLLSSYACAIPGVMAARTIENPKDRLTTIMVAPLMSCSARLPVYMVMLAVMLPAGNAMQKAGIMVAMYAVGTLTAFAMAGLLKATLLKGERPMLLLELPPYRMPSAGTIGLRMLDRGWIFLKRAGTVIFALSILLWAAVTYPKHPNAEATPSDRIAYSVGGRVGRAIEPAIAPLGFDWKTGIGLVGSFAAREVFVSTMGIIYNIEGDSDEENVNLASAMRAERHPDGRPVYTARVSIALMVFYVLAMQCISTVAVVRRETNSWKWPMFQLAYMTALAWVGAFIVAQGGRLLGFE